MSIDALLKPRSIAIVGASDSPARIGGVPLDLLRRAAFQRLYPVNPKNRTAQGLRCWPDIESIGEPVDLAIIALSADATLPYLKRCHAIGVKAAIVYAAGYAETNEAEGRARQDELATFARQSGMAIAGPNCMGNANFTDGIFTAFGVSFQPGEPAGSIALLTQSGNMCATVFRMARRAGVAFSHVINTGNEAAVEFSDYLQFLADDPATTAVLCYIEELRNGPAFLRAAAALRRKGKLLAVYKVGTSEKGAEATRSHTAALAGNASAYDAAFVRAGVARATELSGLADLAYLHTLGNKCAGSRCAILTVSGAAGAILADALATHGGEVPTLPADVQTALRSKIPSFGMVSNPVDLTGNLVNANDFICDAIKLALGAADVDVALLYLPGNFLGQALEQVERAASETGKAIIVIDTFALADRDRLAKAGIGCFDDLDRAARAVCAYANWKKAGISEPRQPLIRTEWPPIHRNETALSETSAKAALARFGVPVVADRLVTDAGEARSTALEIGFPLVMKIVSPDVAHKTEYGLIRLNLRSADDVASAFAEMATKARSLPGVRIEGAILEPMLAGGVEILAGASRDPVFGWVLTVGMGGILTEIMKDVRHSLLPVDAAGAERMLRSLRGARLLDGYRGAPKADVPAAANAIAALSDAVLAAGDRVRDIEINPLMVLPEGRGAYAADALVLLSPENAG